MNTTSYVFQSAFPMIWLGVAVVGATVRTRHLPAGPARLEIWQRWWALGALGFGSLWMFLSFVGIPEFMSAAIGFAQTPFETEIGFANLGLAIMGFRAASAKASARERITIGLGAGMFLWGAVIGHVYQWFANGDHAPGNTGGVLVYDLLIPTVMIVLAHRSLRANTTEQPSTAALAQATGRL